jgi:hypothetical protein
MFLFLSTNSPYISGDVLAKTVDYAPWNTTRESLFKWFALFSQEKFKKTPTISLTKLQKANSIFIPSHELEQFVDKYGSSINAKVLICGNSDFNFTAVPKMPKSVERMFLQNSSISNSVNIFTLPIGLENISLGRSGLKKYHKPRECKKIIDMVLFPPMSPTNKSRFDALIWSLENLDISAPHPTLVSPKEYFDIVSGYKFVFCGEGNGFDTHRIWEVLYQGSFPVLLENEWSSSLSMYGLPILYIQNFDELSKEMLHDFFVQNEAFDPAAAGPLWTKYWAKLIHQLC